MKPSHTLNMFGNLRESSWPIITQITGRIGRNMKKKKIFKFPNVCCHIMKSSRGCNGKYSSLIVCTQCKTKKFISSSEQRIDTTHVNIHIYVNHIDTLERIQKVVRQFNLRIQHYFRSQIQPLKKGLKYQVQRKHTAFKLNIRNGRHSSGLHTASSVSTHAFHSSEHTGPHHPSLLHNTFKRFKARQKHLHKKVMLPEHL